MHTGIGICGIMQLSACRRSCRGRASNRAGLTLATVVSNLERSPAGGDRFVLATYVRSDRSSKPQRVKLIVLYLLDPRRRKASITE